MVKIGKNIGQKWSKNWPKLVKKMVKIGQNLLFQCIVSLILHQNLDWWNSNFNLGAKIHICLKVRFCQNCIFGHFWNSFIPICWKFRFERLRLLMVTNIIGHFRCWMNGVPPIFFFCKRTMMTNYFVNAL